MNPSHEWRDFLLRISSLRLLSGLLVAYLFFVAVVFPWLGSGLNAAEGGPLDLRFHYTEGEAYSLLESMGPDGRRGYAISAMTVDVLYPVTYTLLFSVALALLLGDRQRRHQKPALAQLALGLPPLVMAFDMLENAGIVIMIVRFPKHCAIIATGTSLTTTAKWSTAAVVILLVLVLSATRLWHRFTAKRPAP